MYAHDLWMLPKASSPEETKAGKLLRAGKPGLSLEAPNSARWEKRENIAQEGDEGGRTDRSML